MRTGIYFNANQFSKLFFEIVFDNRSFLVRIPLVKRPPFWALGFLRHYNGVYFFYGKNVEYFKLNTNYSISH